MKKLKLPKGYGRMRMLLTRLLWPLCEWDCHKWYLPKAFFKIENYVWETLTYYADLPKEWRSDCLPIGRTEEVFNEWKERMKVEAPDWVLEYQGWR